MRLIKQGPSALAIARKRGGKGGVIVPDKPKNTKLAKFKQQLAKKNEKFTKKPANFLKKCLQKSGQRL